MSIKFDDVYEMLNVEISRTNIVPVYEKGGCELIDTRRKVMENIKAVKFLEDILVSRYTNDSFEEKLVTLKLNNYERYLLRKCRDGNVSAPFIASSDIHELILLLMYHFEDDVINYSFARFLKRVKGQNFEIEPSYKSISLTKSLKCMELVWVTSGLPTNIVPELVCSKTSIGFKMQTRNHGKQLFLFPNWYLKRIACKYAVIAWLCLYNRSNMNYCLSLLSKDIFIKIGKMLSTTKREGCWLPFHKKRERKKSKNDD